MSSWSVAAAKARFSAVVDGARRSPQKITRRGQPVAVVLGIEQYQRVSGIGGAAKKHPMADFLALSEQLRGQGSLGMRLPRRRLGRSRPSPFAGS